MTGVKGAGTGFSGSHIGVEGIIGVEEVEGIIGVGRWMGSLLLGGLITLSLEISSMVVVRSAIVAQYLLDSSVDHGRASGCSPEVFNSQSFRFIASVASWGRWRAFP